MLGWGDFPGPTCIVEWTVGAKAMSTAPAASRMKPLALGPSAFDGRREAVEPVADPDGVLVSSPVERTWLWVRLNPSTTPAGERRMR